MKWLAKSVRSVFAAAVTVSVAPALASEVEGDTDPVYVFNRICYAQVPDIQRIRDMALELAWKPLDNEAVEQFTPQENPDVLEGWDAQVGERVYRVGIVQSDPVDGMKTAFPEFAEGTATSCTLVLDGLDDGKIVSERMQLLAGKEPVSRDVPEGFLKTTTWAGGNADLRVFLVSKADATGQGGLLNVTVLTRE